MIYPAKEVKALYRFNGQNSLAVMLQGKVLGRKSLIEGLEPDFPIGLFAKDSPLYGGTVDVICLPQAGDQQTTKYILAKWGNQSDAIKAALMASVISVLSAGGLETIPWKDEFENQPSKEHSLKEKLEKLYSDKSEQGLITPINYSKELSLEIEDEEEEEDSEDLSDDEDSDEL